MLTMVNNIVMTFINLLYMAANVDHLPALRTRKFENIEAIFQIFTSTKKHSKYKLVKSLHNLS